jgi:hypothetical protein
MSSYILLHDPFINEKSILGMSSVFIDDVNKKTYAFLYLPEKKCAVCTSVVKRPYIKKLSQERFTAKIEAFKTRGVKCIHVTEVRVPSSLANSLDSDKEAQVMKSIRIISFKYFQIKRVAN